MHIPDCSEPTLRLVRADSCFNVSVVFLQLYALHIPYHRRLCSPCFAVNNSSMSVAIKTIPCYHDATQNFHCLKRQGPQSPPTSISTDSFDLHLELGVLKSIARSIFTPETVEFTVPERVASYPKARGRIHDTVLLHLDYFSCPFPVFPKPTQLG